MKALKITQCSDSLMWYRKYIGCVVPLLNYGHSATEFLSREPAGYTNIVRKQDCEVIDLSKEDILYRSIQ